MWHEARKETGVSIYTQIKIARQELFSYLHTDYLVTQSYCVTKTDKDWQSPHLEEIVVVERTNTGLNVGVFDSNTLWKPW